MRRMILTWLRLLGLAVLLAGCAAAPPRHYSLAAPAMVQAASSGAARTPGAGLLLSVARIPVETERPQLVVRAPGRDPAVQVLNDSLWAAPLSDQIRDALALGVSHRLGVVDLRRLPEAQSQFRSIRRVDVRIDRFDMVWGHFVALDADWTDRAPDADHVRLCRASVRLPADDGVAALVEAQRQALGLLAALIADAALGQPVDLQGKTTVSEFGCT
ncbi:MAG: PqiC family protein [Castellaniella sp.]|uniref:PqiC family protein n=1 Tax=Castellaniella sp. TaxID=1955812 RepID=UPI002A3683AF|nr:PqiC family protein [Castellaniella sp.]MDY0309292.1 PqiC family protein [Castellaniella sp.]